MQRLGVATAAGYVVVIGSFILLWHVMSVVWPSIMPNPLASFHFAYTLKEELLGDSLITLSNTLAGFLIALTLAIASAGLARLNRYARMVVEALNTIIQSVSALVWALFFLLIFGFASKAPAISVAAATAYPILLSSILKGFEYAESEYGEVAKLVRASRLQSLRYILLPASTPFIVAASRSAIGSALRISVVAEAFGASGGIGYRLWLFYEVHEYRGFMSWAFTLLLLMLLIDKLLLEPVERWARKWQE
ncbi:MAG: ABC transporter permease subunit [Desulfurococcales archaeon]|nr:ABC transporter permease subunit [Desulfurococcales archaeon]